MDDQKLVKDYTYTKSWKSVKTYCDSYDQEMTEELFFNCHRHTFPCRIPHRNHRCKGSKCNKFSVCMHIIGIDDEIKEMLFKEQIRDL